MSTTPRVSSAIPGEPPHFGSVLAHQPAIAASFFALYGREKSIQLIDDALAGKLVQAADHG